MIEMQSTSMQDKHKKAPKVQGIIQFPWLRGVCNMCETLASGSVWYGWDPDFYPEDNVSVPKVGTQEPHSLPRRVTPRPHWGTYEETSTSDSSVPPSWYLLLDSDRAAIGLIMRIKLLLRDMRKASKESPLGAYENLASPPPQISQPLPHPVHNHFCTWSCIGTCQCFGSTGTACGNMWI